MRYDPKITWRHAVTARTFQLVFPALQRAFYRSPELEFATAPIAPPATVRVPTRHGEIDALVFAPTATSVAAQRARGERPPVHLLTHGGAFITRYPAEEGNVARYLASEVGCYVVVPDYSAAPQVRHPVAEQQCSDTLTWIRAGAAARGWDGDRVSVGGPSAGGQIALQVALDAIDTGGYVPVAVTTEYGVADLARPRDQRPSATARPVVGPALVDLVVNTYFAGVDLTTPQASPLRHPALHRLPPTLVLTAEHDTLRHESNDLAAALRELGVEVGHRQFAGVDHGFTHRAPVAVARAAITMIGDHLAGAYRRALVAH